MTDILQQATELSFQYETEFMTWGPVVVLLILALILIPTLTLIPTLMPMLILTPRRTWMEVGGCAQMMVRDAPVQRWEPTPAMDRS